MAIATFVFVCFFHIKLLKERKNVRFITFLFGFSLTYLYLCKKKKKKIDRQSFWEIVRFGTVGTTSMLIHYGIYYLLLPLMDMNIAYSIGYFLSFLCNFLMSSYFTFKVKPSWKRLVRFTGSHGINYFVYLGLFNFFYWVGVPAELAPLPVYLIAVPISFLLVRFALKKK